MALEGDIHRLLYAHDCVIVPGLGGFLTHYRSARLDEQRQVIHPPGKDLSFNRHLVRTDGLLAHEVAAREGLDLARAGRVVDAEVDTWKQRLERDGRLELGRIGTFYRDPEHNLQFEPDKRVNFLKDAYGLRSVPALPVVAPAPVGIPSIAPSVATVSDDGVRTPRRTSGLAAAAATAAVLFTAATWWVVTRDVPTGAQWSGFDLFGPGEVRHYKAPSAAAVIAPILDTLPWSAPSGFGVQALPIAGEGGPLVAVDLGQAPVAAAPESTAVATRQVQVRYHIIGGCFLQRENADKFAADLQAKGFAASVIDRKGDLYRVAYGSYPQRSLALEALNAVRKEEAPQAWLLVK